MVKPIEIVYTIVGEVPGETATTSVKIASTELIDQITGYAVAFATLVNNVIWGKLLSAAFVIDVDLSALTNNTVVPAADVEEVAALQFRAGPYFTDVTVPGISEIDVLPDTHLIDQSNTSWAALISMFEDGLPVTGGTIQPCDKGEEDITALVYAREEHRNSGRKRAS